MKRLRCALAIFGLLLLTVPWLFLGREVELSDSIPAWAAYVLTSLVAFPVVLALMLKRWWRIFDSES